MHYDMKNGFIHLIDLEFEYKMWKKRLEVFISEVDLLIKHNQNLPEERKKFSLNSIELLALEEHKERLISLKKKLEIKEHELQFYNKDFPITTEHEYFKDHLELRKKNEQLLYIHIDRVNDIIKEIGISLTA